jgi:hypothetical protein
VKEIELFESKQGSPPRSPIPRSPMRPYSAKTSKQSYQSFSRNKMRPTSAKSTAALTSPPCSKSSSNYGCGIGLAQFPFQPIATTTSQHLSSEYTSPDCDFSYHGKNGGSPMTMCMGNDAVVLGGTQGLLGLYSVDSNSLITMQT